MIGDLTTLDNVKQWLGITGLPIQGISNASPAVITLYTQPSTPLVTGLVVGIDGVNGMTGLNGNSYPITMLTATTLSIPFNAIAAGTYTFGGLLGVTDALLQRLIDAVSTFIQNYITRTIALTSYNETRNGLGGRVMTFKNAPCTAVSSVSIDGVSVPVRPALSSTVQGTTFPPVGFSFDDTRLYLDGYYFCRGNQNVNIQYSAGYAATPPDIEQAAIDMIGDWFRYMSRIGKVSEGIEGQTITFSNAQISPRSLAILNVYNQRAPIY